MVPQILPLPIPSTYLPIHRSLIILLLDAISLQSCKCRRY
jgi:hypothetical protein